MEWTDEQVVKLIGLYEMYPVLWDPQHKHYKLNNKKNDAWMEIKNALNEPVADLKKKMASLLASFRRERQKITKTLSGMGTSEVYSGNWFAYKHLTFLCGKYQPKQTTSTLETEENIDSPMEKDEESVPTNVENASPASVVEERASGSTQRLETTSFMSNKKKRKTSDPLVDEVVATLRDVKKQTAVNKDSFAKYGDYIAEELRHLDQYSAAYAQKLVSEIIFKAKLGYYKPRENAPMMSPRSVPTPMFSPSETSSTSTQLSYFHHETSLVQPENNETAEEHVLDFQLLH